MEITIEVLSDIICPWCYIGKRRLETALAAPAAERPDARVRPTWLPFELNPTTPPEGKDRKAYRSAKPLCYPNKGFFFQKGTFTC